MLDAAMKTQLGSYLEKLLFPIEITAWTGDDEKSAELRSLLADIGSLSDKVSLRDGDAADNERRPSFRIRRADSDIEVRFAGIPLGHEFTSLVLALLQVGGHPPKVDAAVLEQIRAIEGEHVFETFISLSCQNCPDVVQALNLMAVVNPRIRHTMIDGAVFPEEVEQRQVMAVPMVFHNGEVFGQGRMGIEEILAKIDTGHAQRQAQAIGEKPVFDVLVVGGGPAGAAAAIYAARKGIRTGIVSERFGGQVLDTLAIENFISVKATEGPKLAAAMEEHVREYDVDVMNLQRAVALVAPKPGEVDAEGRPAPIEVKLESGASVRSRTVILSTGAKWREMGVPGEREFKGKGVAYCPHCDGPLFKGKRVAVIGGGNSGVEAAIDLANIVHEVTLLEFDHKLRADQVLQTKLHSLPNVTVHTGAQTTEVPGDGQKVSGLKWVDRQSGEARAADLEGVFVQIGLLPNTEWLKGTIDLSNRGEIEVDAFGRTNVPGVFAAGDCTTVPYKQIVIAMGEGSKAALSAFDHLIRTSVPQAQAA